MYVPASSCLQLTWRCRPAGASVLAEDSHEPTETAARPRGVSTLAQPEPGGDIRTAVVADERRKDDQNQPEVAADAATCVVTK